MKSLFYLIILFSLCLGTFSSCKKSSPESEAIYTCSMHPQVRHKGPGTCPICGMELVPITTLQAQSPAESHAEHEQPASAAPSVQLMPAQSSVASIRTEAATLRSITKKIEVFGEISSIQDTAVNYTWYYGGRVQKLLVNSNTTEVKKGQPILKVYSEEALADVQAYLDALRERWMTTFYERDLMTAKIQAVRARLEKIGMDDKALENLVEEHQVPSEFTIRAPASGSLVGTLPKVGSRFKADEMLFAVAPLDKIWFTADVYEKDLPLLKLGQKAEISSQGRPDQVFTGKLVFIDRSIDPTKRTFKARFEIENPQKNLIPQLSAVGKIEITEPQALTIPSSAVIDTGTRKIVYVETAPQNYQPREVQISFSGDLLAAVKKGLQEGEKIVVDGAFLVDAEAQLRGGGTESKSTMPPMPGMQH